MAANDHINIFSFFCQYQITYFITVVFIAQMR